MHGSVDPVEVCLSVIPWVVLIFSLGAVFARTSVFALPTKEKKRKTEFYSLTTLSHGTQITVEADTKGREAFD